MATLTANATFTLDGDADVAGVAWGDGRWLLALDLFAPTAGPVRTATVRLLDEVWTLGLLHFGGDARAVVTDAATGTGRVVETIALADVAGNSVTLKATKVGTVTGGTAGDSVTTGATYLDTLDLRGGDNVARIGVGGAGAVLGGTGDDTVGTGSGYVATIAVGRGANVVTVGSGGAGVVQAGEGADTVTTGPGYVATLDAGRGANVVTVGRGGAGAVLTGEEDDRVATAGGYVDVLRLGGGADRLDLGGGGAGTVDLGRDADTVVVTPLDLASRIVSLNGGTGVSAAGERDFDTLDLSRFDADLVVDLAGLSTVRTGSGDLEIRGFEAVIGGSGDDRLSGSAADDLLRGGAGADTLVGGRGADDLQGGSGADRFVFTRAADSTVAAAGRDTVLDFRRADGDRIDLRPLDGDPDATGDQALVFIGADAYGRTAGELRTVKVAGATLVTVDLDGDGRSDLSMRVDGALTLAASDFLL